MGGIIRKTALLWVIVFVIAVIITVQAAYSLRMMEVDTSFRSCRENGIARFHFDYLSGEGIIDLDDVTVFADGVEIEGEWYRCSQDPKNLEKRSSFKKQQCAMFVSDFRELLEHKTYDIEIKYPDDDGSTKSVEIEISCPGFIFACGMFKMSLDNCYNRGGSVYLEISGSGFGEFGANLTKDFTYILKGSSKRHQGSLENTTAVISKVKENFYLMEFPLGYNVYWAYIRGTPYGCDVTIDDFDTITYKKCTTSSETTTAPLTGAATVDIGEAEDDKPSGEVGEPAKKDESTQLGLLGRIVRFFLSILKV